VSVVSFTATPGNRKVTLKWKTDDEKANTGFNILRSESEGGPFEQVNDDLIAAEGAAGAGAEYSYVDRRLKNRRTYYYQLQNVDTTGASYTRGEAEATPRLIFWLRDLMELLRTLFGPKG
jgi:hypothetical protein